MVAEGITKVEIRKGQIDAHWSTWFDNPAAEYMNRHETNLRGTVAARGDLDGLLARLRDLGLQLLSVNCGEDRVGTAA